MRNTTTGVEARRRKRKSDSPFFQDFVHAHMWANLYYPSFKEINCVEVARTRDVSPFSAFSWFHKYLSHRLHPAYNPCLSRYKGDIFIFNSCPLLGIFIIKLEYPSVQHLGHFSRHKVPNHLHLLAHLLCCM